MQSRARGRQLRQPALDGRVDVLVAFLELEPAGVELALDPTQPAFDRRELASGDQAGRRQPARMRDAARDVVRVQLDVELE